MTMVQAGLVLVVFGVLTLYVGIVCYRAGLADGKAEMFRAMYRARRVPGPVAVNDRAEVISIAGSATPRDLAHPVYLFYQDEAQT